jgi:SAM-dependent methyltransferase
VLKPGGVFISLTPNRWHYVATVASVTPLAFHRWVNRHRGRSEEDTFPTTYKLNTRHDQERWFGAPAFKTVLFERFEVSPNYLTFSAPTFFAGVAWERTVNALPQLERFRAGILSVFERV